MSSRLLFIHAMSPLHPGTGQSVGAIDLAIAREKATGIPYLPGSSIKGVIRDCESGELQDKVFGPKPVSDDVHSSGAVSFGDAKVLFMPVRSFAGTFAYVTSPFLLQRARRDLEMAGLGALPHVPLSAVERCVISDETLLECNNKVYFEELDFNRDKRPEVESISNILGPYIFGEGGGDWLRQRLCIVHDDVMSYFFEQGTEVRARIRLKEDTKVVEEGALWYEESLPAETVLLSLLHAFPPKSSKLSKQNVFEYVHSLIKRPLQFGGNATIGQGFCSLQLVGGEK